MARSCSSRLRGGRRRAQLEDRLRELVRDGTLAAGERMPSSRALAGDLGVSRRLVVDAYAQLLAEGYLVARQGAGTYVADGGEHRRAPAPAPSRRARRSSTSSRARQTSRPSRARCGCARCARCCATAPDGAFAYPDARGAPELRRALSAYLRRVRGVVAEPESIVVCAGATQGLALLGRALRRARRDGDRRRGSRACRRIARVLDYAGMRVRGARVDEHGLDVASLRSPVVLSDAGAPVPDGRRALAAAPRRARALGARRRRS